MENFNEPTKLFGCCIPHWAATTQKHPYIHNSQNGMGCIQIRYTGYVAPQTMYKPSIVLKNINCTSSRNSIGWFVPNIYVCVCNSMFLCMRNYMWGSLLFQDDIFCSNPFSDSPRRDDNTLTGCWTMWLEAGHKLALMTVCIRSLKRKLASPPSRP